MAVLKKKATPPKVSPVGSAPARVDSLKDVREYYARNGHVPTELANESRTRYGMVGDSKLYADLGIKVARGQMTKAQALAQIRNGAGVDDIHRRAGDAVNVELDPQISNYQRQAAMAQQSADQQIGQNNTDTDRYAAAVQALYQRLGRDFQASNDKVQQSWQQEQQKTGSAYDQLIANTQGTYQTQQTDVTDLASKLNLSGAPTANQQMATDQQFLTGLFGGQKQSAVDMLVANGLIDQSYGQRFGAAQQAAGAQYQTQAREENLRSNRDLRNETARTVFDLQGRAGDLESTRGAKLRENIAALEDARLQARNEAEAQAFDRQIAQAKLELQRQELGIDAAYKSGQLEIGRTNAQTSQQRVQLESRKTEAQLKKEMAALTPGTLEYEEKLAAINLKKSQTKKNIADYTKPPKPVDYPKGTVGAQQYLSSMGDQNFVNAGMHEVALAIQYGKDYSDAVRFMRNNFSKFSEFKNNPSLQTAYLNALDLAWTRSKNPAKK